MAQETKPANRKRASSLAKTLDYLRDPPESHRLGEFSGGDTSAPSPVTAPPDPPDTNFNTAPRTAVAHRDEPSPFALQSEGLWRDLQTFRWMRVPASSLKMIAIVLALWAAFHYLLPGRDNPIDALVRISYPLTTPFQTRTYYKYGYRDLAFLAFYVLVFSFIRQASTLYIIAPIARLGGIRKEAKIERFMEQGYAVLYFSVFGSLGIYVMRGLPTWWYKTEYFWIDYPHRMTPEIKVYYLLQLAYWLQQILVLVLRIEKPRPDFVELCIHHIVTIWLVGWSYSAHLTRIGNAIFVTMDVSDVFLALAKCLNYVKLQRTSEVVFVFFVGVWTYLRHYLNLKILWSVWTQYSHLVPSSARYFLPGQKGVWLAPWMRYQVLTPIALLQLVNLFWYYLIWRIIARILIGQAATDVREEQEDSE